MSMSDSTSDSETFEEAFSAPEPSGETAGGGDKGEAASEGGQARDERGRFATDRQEEPAGEGGDEGKADDGASRRIPLPEYLSEREKRQAAERRAEEAERRWEAFQRQQAQQRQEPEQPPDLIADPDGFLGHVDKRFKSVEQMVQDRLIDMTFADQHEANPEEFPKAYRALAEALKTGDQTARKVVQSANPGKKLMTWYRQTEAAREVGGDLPGYLKRKQDEWEKDPEVRKRVVASMDAEARGGDGNGSSSTVTRLPPSLNRAPGSARAAAGNESDRELFEENFSARRRA